jgi:hypothetical protein
MTGPVPRHDHQSIDQWAQQGLVNSEGRTSPESEVPDSGALDAAGIPTAPAGAPPGETTTTPAGSAEAGLAGVEDEDSLTAGGKPGAVATPGDAAETAAYEGDGAYSGGWHASGPPAG